VPSYWGCCDRFQWHARKPFESRKKTYGLGKPAAGKHPMTKRDLDDFLDQGLSTFYRLVARERSDASASALAAEPDQPVTRADPVLPARLGRLEIGSVIGRGGMGVVVRAFDPQLGRDVAVKLLQEPFSSDAELVQRFLDEAKVSSQLQHPGIVPIYDIGTSDDGWPFYTMKIVDGDTLKERIDARRRPRVSARSLEVFARVCETVAFAHSRGVVHGDLKPANVMVGAFGEVQVLDWGFAKAMTMARKPVAEQDETDSSALRVLGTPAYMAPEQAIGDIEAIDERTDVFGLGGILCEILTGAPAYLGESRNEVMLRASKGWLDDAYQRLDVADADRALVDIARACLVANQSDRLADAGKVSDMVGAYLASVEDRTRALAVEAAGARAVAQQEKRARRLTVAMAIAIVVALICVGGAYLWVQNEHRDNAAERERLLGESMARATVLLGEARSAPVGDHAAWQLALGAARQSAEIASSGGTSDSLRVRARSLVAEIEAEQASAFSDERTRSRLEEIRLLREDRDGSNQDVAYEAAFAEYGLPIDNLEVAPAADRVQASRIRDDLILGLDEWAIWQLDYRVAGPQRFKKLVAIAQRADGNAWRKSLRDMLLAGDVEQMIALAGSEDLSGAPAAGLLVLARLLATRKGNELAVRVFRKARLQWPDDFWIQHDLASQLQGLEGLTEEVVGLSWSCVALRPDSPHAWTDLGVRLLNRGEDRIGYTALERALQVDPTYTRAEATIGSQRCANGDDERGLAALQRAAERADGDARLLLTLGTGYEFDAFRPRQALDFYRRAAELQARAGDTHIAYGSSLMRHGRPDAAVEEILRGLELDPRNPDARAVLGQARVRSGSFDEAVVDFEIGAEVDGASGTHQWVQSRDYAARLAAAAPRVTAAAREMPDDAEELVLWARAALFTGAPDTATRLFERAFELEPEIATTVIGSHTPVFNAACAAVRAEQPDQARQWLALSLAELSAFARRNSRDRLLRFRIVEHFARDEFEPYRAGGGAADAAWTELWRDFSHFRDGLRRGWR